MEKPKFYKKLADYCATLPEEFSKISEERKSELKEFGDYIVGKKQSEKDVKITVICTHNSRRSHMGQLWLLTASAFYGVADIRVFSGGTEATAFNSRAVSSLERAGFQIEKTSSKNGEDNPVYLASVGKSYPKIYMYSKKYDEKQNPKSEFAAVMVCSDADATCPLVPGADGRFAISFEDPKHYDNTPSEQTKYDERCRQIASEMFYVMDYVKKGLIVKN